MRSIILWSMMMVVALCTVSTSAVQVLYTSEGDSTNATDTLTGDGLQNGIFVSDGVNTNINIDVNGVPMFGTNAFLFQSTASRNDVIEIPNTKALGAEFTLAAWIDTARPGGVQRFFGTYTGGSLVANNILFDFDPDNIGVLGHSMRFFVNGSLTTADATFNDNLYHHIAATYSNGVVNLYLDGLSVGSGNAGSGPINLLKNLRVGNDYVFATTGDTQFKGDMDDVLVWDEALSASEIQQLVRFGGTIFFNGDLTKLGVLYTAEGDTTYATDGLTGDGLQNGIFVSDGVNTTIDIDVNGTPRFGSKAFLFKSSASRNDAIEIPNSKKLGKQFTLAAWYIDPLNGKRHQRLFSNYNGNGFLFDFDPDKSIGFSMRFFRSGASSVNATATFADSNYHHLAATYDDGAVILYLDGVAVANGSVGSGAVLLARDLRVGEDYVFSTTGDAQLRGSVDDVVLLYEALSPADMMKLKTIGAQKFFNPPSQGTMIIIW